MTEPITPESQPPASTIGSRLSQFLNRLAKPSNTISDPVERRQVRFLATILLAFAILTAVNIPVRLLSGSAWERPLEFWIVTGLTALLFLAYSLSRSKHYHYAPALAMITLVSLIYSVFFLGGYSPSSLLWLPPMIILASTIFSLRDTFLFAMGNILFLMVLPLLVPGISYESVASGLSILIVTTVLILILNQYRNRLEALRQQELTTANQELQALSQTLEDRVQERTSDLALASEVGRAISQIRDLDELLTQAVNLIQQRFNLYYTQVYLTDEARQRLVLRAGTGQVGQTLLAQAHSLPVDGSSINGTAAFHKEAVIVADTQTSPIFRRNAALPDTRSEMAVPLLVQDQVVGVIDLQSDQPNALSSDNLPAFTALAGQLAVAIESADLFQKQASLTLQMQETTGFLDSVVESLPIMLFVKDAEDLRFVRWNQTGINITGFSKEALLGKNDYDFFPKEEADFFTAKDREVLNGGVQVDIPEEPIHTAHQGTRLLHTTKVPILSAEGQPKYLLGISQDITERKQMEQQLAERLKQLNLLNEIGRKAEEVSAVDVFMTWVTERVSQTMSQADACIAAISLDGRIYGDAQAIELPRHMVEELRIRGETVGWIYIAYTDESLDFRDEDSSLIGSVGRRISSYVENQRLLTRLQGQAENLQKVAEISTAVATTRNPYQLAQEAAELTQHYFGLYQTAVFTLEEEYLVPAGAAGVLNQEQLGQGQLLSIHATKSLIAKAARTRQGLMVNDTAVEPDFLVHPLLPYTQSEIVVPLIVGEQVLGVLDLQANEIGSFSEETLNIFTTLASQIAVALQNARQYQQTQAALEELSSLQRVITGESWEAFMTAQERPVQGYLASRQTIQPLVQKAEAAKTGNGDSTAVPLSQLTLDASHSYVAPVEIRGTTIGKLGIRSTAEAPISTENQAILDAISQQVADALERARLLEESETSRQKMDERARQLAAINEVAQTVSQQLDIEQVLSTVHEQISQAMKVDAFLVSQYDAATNLLTYLYIYDDGNRYQEAPVLLDKESRTYKVVSSGTPLLINFPPEQERLDTGTVGNARLSASLMFVPLVIGGQTIGVVSAQSYEYNAYTENDLELLQGIANHMAVALENARLFSQTQEALAETQKRTEELGLVNQIVTQLGSSLDIQQAMQVVAQGLVEGTGVDQARIALLDGDRQTLTIIAEHFDPARSSSALGLQIPVEGNQLTQQVLTTRQPVIVADALNNPLTAPVHDLLRGQGIHALAVLPMLVGNEVLGTVGMDLLSEGAMISDEALRLAETIIFQAAATIQNARLFAQTEAALAEVQETTGFLDSVIENLPVMLFVKDAEDLRFVRWNKAGSDITGFPPEAYMGKTDYDFVSEEQANFFVAKDREVLAGGEIVEIPDEPIQTVHKGTRVLHTRKVPILDAAGKPKYLLGISEDITERRQFEEALAKRALELQMVAEISTAVTSNLDTSRLLQDVADLTRDNFGLYHAHIYLMNERGDKLVLTAGAGQAGAQMVAEGRTIALDSQRSLVARAARTRQGVIANDVTADEGFLPHPLLPETRSEMAVPLVIGNQVIGVLDVQSEEVNHFTTQDINIQTTLASQVATALQNARLFSQTEKRAAELATINVINQVASSELNLSTLLEAAGKQLQETFDAHAFYIALFNEPTGMLTFPYFMERDEGVITLAPRQLGQDEGGFAGQIIQSKRPLLLETPTANATLQQGGQVVGSGRMTDTYLGVPILSGDTVLGVIGMSTYREIRIYNESDRDLLMTLAGIMSVAIQNAQQFEATRRRAERERIVNEITQKIQSSLSMESALQTAVKELGQALGARYTQVELTLADQPAAPAHQGNGSRRKAG
jgi:PAS domain S-box-containing protein